MFETKVMMRSVYLTDDWYKNYYGEIVTKTNDGQKVHLIASRLGGYRYYDNVTQKYHLVTHKNQSQFAKEASLYYRPLPYNANFFNLLTYMLHTLSIKDVFLILLSTIMVTLIGILYPLVTNLLYNKIIVAHRSALLPIVFIIFLGIIVTGSLFSIIKNIVLAGIRIKMSTLVETAFWGRCIVLPVSFYRQNSTGQVSEWLEGISNLCENISNLFFGTWFASLLSLLYIVQIYLFTPSMTIPTVLIVIVFFTVTFFSAFLQSKWTRKQMLSNSKLTGLLYDLLNNIEKIKLDNARERVLHIWFQQYDEVSRYTYASPLIVRLSSTLPVLLSTLGSIIVLLSAKSSGLTSGEYMTFYSAFGMVLGAVMSAGQTANILATVKPQYEMLSPILSATPEFGTQEVDTVSDADYLDIELDHVSFGYNPEQAIINDLSVKIPYGDYVAIVGDTGCGKSTLLRLLLGFETPQDGVIRYNGEDFNKQNPMIIRQNMGVVLQNDRLFPGSLLENLKMAHPDVSEKQIWEALRIAGIDEDVRAMPMRLQTLVGERSAFSGGQNQRLQIARAILGNPKILIMDEATSALDNETQAKVANALDSMKCTRIVVAHRLSTIRNARRILVLDKGKIVEDGTYDKLLSDKGKFFKLVDRQLSNPNV